MGSWMGEMALAKGEPRATARMGISRRSLISRVGKRAKASVRRPNPPLAPFPILSRRCPGAVQAPDDPLTLPREGLAAWCVP
ncbi:hypothetical protein P7K49_010846 [Saguinus oedipus]|uniref:Uncharacterized protein n=1 Tax=Saguinus oedipus TaxID=9490 RepID=A0ABQ9VPK5_SAGOE|nr:hypothetical protein P7K49_010846 [Saguinus oedipus]